MSSTATQSESDDHASNPGDRSGALGILWVHPHPMGAFDQGSRNEQMIGRGPDCQVVLDDESVSRHHARFHQADGVLCIADAGSRNGIRVNGKRYKHARLSYGDVVRLGNFVGVVTSMTGRPFEKPFRQLPPGLLAGPHLLSCLEPVLRVANSDLSVVIEGDTGCGKEMVANALHMASGRPGPFVAVNCAAVPSELAEAEFFGHARGAFTGAGRERLGHIREANRGTLFLDEIVDLPLALGAKLLRALEQREVVPLGESRPVPVDVRVIVAAQGALTSAVEAGTFRRDLYARLCGAVVRLPPLAGRREEIPYMFRGLLARLSSQPPPAPTAGLIEALCVRDWPLNVRDLVNLTRRLLALHGDKPLLRREHLHDADVLVGRSTPPGAAPSLPTLLQSLELHDGNLSQAAIALGLSRGRAYRMLRGTSVPIRQSKS